MGAVCNESCTYGYEGGIRLEDVASDPIDFIAEKAYNFGYQVSFKTIDKGLLEVCGPAGVYKTIHELGGRKVLVQVPFFTDTRVCLAATIAHTSKHCCSRSEPKGPRGWGGIALFPGECI